MTLRELVKDFLVKYRYKLRTNPDLKRFNVQRLLVKDEKGYEYSLSAHYGPDASVQPKDPQKYLRKSICCSIKAAPQKKGAIAAYKLFCEYLRSEHSLNLDMEWPAIDTENSFERIMYMAKYLQDPQAKIKDLAQKLLISERTAENDWSVLKGNTKNRLQICGRVFKVSEVKRRLGAVTFQSTAHPLFLCHEGFPAGTI